MIGDNEITTAKKLTTDPAPRKDFQAPASQCLGPEGGGAVVDRFLLAAGNSLLFLGITRVFVYEFGK
jgi:hypothetical protein